MEQVRHASFGTGEVVASDGEGAGRKLTVRFYRDGVTRQLLARFLVPETTPSSERADAAVAIEQGAALLAAVQARPDDDAARLVYADHLGEIGDARGELITLQCQLAALPASDPRRPALKARETELLQNPRFVERWRPIQPRFHRLDDTTAQYFDRGFLRDGWVTAQTFNPEVSSQLAGELVERLEVDVADRSLVMGLAAAPWLSRVTELYIRDPVSVLQADHIAVLTTSPHLRDLRILGLNTVGLDKESARRLASWPHRRLTRLLLANFDRARQAASVVAALADSPHLRGLRELAVYGNDDPWRDEGGRYTAEIADMLTLWVGCLDQLSLLAIDDTLDDRVGAAMVEAGFRRGDEFAVAGWNLPFDPYARFEGVRIWLRRTSKGGASEVAFP